MKRLEVKSLSGETMRRLVNADHPSPHDDGQTHHRQRTRCRPQKDPKERTLYYYNYDDII